MYKDVSTIKELQQDHERSFWQEVNTRFDTTVPKQVKRKLTGFEYAPGERAALALFWAGLKCYANAFEVEKKHKEVKQFSNWLDPFRKAAKAYDRSIGKTTITSHNLALFYHAWEHLKDLATTPLAIEDSALKSEEFRIFWIASYYLFSAAHHLKYPKILYKQGKWTPGFQVDNKELLTNSTGIEYDRLLLRSSSILFQSSIKEVSLLPTVAENWFSVFDKPNRLLGLFDAYDISLCQEYSFEWTDKSFQINLKNDCKLIVEKYKESLVENTFVGVVQVHTPAGFFIEEFQLSNFNDFIFDNIDITFHGNSLMCQPRTKHFNSDMREYFRRRILTEVGLAHINTSRQKPIGRVIEPQKIEVKTSKTKRIRLPKGNLLYGKL